jgi:hypothetical protein
MAAPHEDFAPFFAVWKKVSDDVKGLKDSHASLTAKSDSIVKAAFADPENEAVKKYNAYAADIDAKIAALKAKKDEAKASTTKALVGDIPQATPEEVKASRDAFLEKQKVWRLTHDNILGLLGNDEDALKAGMEAYGIEAVKSLGGGKSATTGGDIVRKRLKSATYNGEDVADANGKVTFTTLSVKSSVSADDLRNAAAEAAGVTSVRDIPNGTTVEFSVGEKSFTITTPDTDAS